MKAKDLIRVLQGLDPESTISLSLGRDGEYRDKCAKAELAVGGCLDFLDFDRIEIYPNGGGDEMYADIVLKQNNLCYLDEEAAKFDKMYSKNEDYEQSNRQSD